MDFIELLAAIGDFFPIDGDKKSKARLVQAGCVVLLFVTVAGVGLIIWFCK